MKCLDCPAELPPRTGSGKPPVRCPACKVAHRKKYDYERHYAARAAARAAKLERPCKWPECTAKLGNASNSAKYCPKHASASYKASCERFMQKRAEAAAARKVEKVKVSPERKKRKSAPVEKDTRDNYQPQGFSQLKGPPLQHDPRRKNIKRRELPPITDLSPDKAVCNCGRKWFIVKSFDVGRLTTPLYVRVGTVERVDKCPRCHSVPAKVGGKVG